MAELLTVESYITHICHQELLFQGALTYNNLLVFTFFSK